MYRDDHNAVFERAQALERELNEAQSARQHDADRIAYLQNELQKAHHWLAAGNQPAMPRAPQPLPPSNANTALVLGILSLALCGLLGPFAWSSGNSELQRMDLGLVDDRDRGSATAGKVCGIIATVLLGFSVLMVLLLVASAPTY